MIGRVFAGVCRGRRKKSLYQAAIEAVECAVQEFTAVSDGKVRGSVRRQADSRLENSR